MVDGDIKRRFAKILIASLLGIGTAIGPVAAADEAGLSRDDKVLLLNAG